MLYLKYWQIDADLENAWSALEKRKWNIGEMKTLKDPNLPENEYLSILERNYTFDASLLESRLDTYLKDNYPKMYVRGRICTDCITHITNRNNKKHDVYLGFWVYTTDPKLAQNSSYFGKKYSLDTIASLVASGDLILLSKTSIEAKSRSFKSISTEEELTSLDTLCLETMSLDDLGVYGEFLVPILKEELSDERLSENIIAVINMARIEAEKISEALNTLYLDKYPTTTKEENLQRTKKTTSEFLSYLNHCN